MKFIARITGICGTAAITLILLYLQINRSGHTGLNPYLANVVFIPALIAGCVSLISRRGDTLRDGIVSLFAGAAGITLLIWLDRSNTLLQYETWIRRGMP